MTPEELAATANNAKILAITELAVLLGSLKFNSITQSLEAPHYHEMASVIEQIIEAAVTATLLEITAIQRRSKV